MSIWSKIKAWFAPTVTKAVGEFDKVIDNLNIVQKYHTVLAKAHDLVIAEYTKLKQEAEAEVAKAKALAEKFTAVSAQ